MKLGAAIVIAATSTAFADRPAPKVTWIGPVDPDGPVEAIKLAGNVAVWSDATFFLDADPDGPRLQLATLATARRDHVGQVVPMKVLATTGAFVEVEPVPGTDCGWTRFAPPSDLAKFRLFVKRSDIALVVVKPFTRTWPDGTRVEVRPGLPVIAMKPEGYRVAVDRVWLTAALPDSSIGYSYTPGKDTRPKTPAHKFLVNPGKVKLGDLTAETIEAFGVPAVTKRGDTALVTLVTTCLQATISVPTASISEGRIGTGSGVGGGKPGNKLGERWVLTKGTALFVPGGKRKVAEVAAEIDVGKPDGKPDVCVIRDIGLDHPYPGTPRPKAGKAKLMLCAPASNVKHVK